MANLERPLPSMVDGLKPAQRKVLFCSFKRNLVKETKVSNLAGYVTEHSAYQDSVQSLVNTIIGMAQDFVGTNNISLLEACGLFGTRYSGGKDAAKSRHIYTRLAPITRLIFPKEDDVLLNYLNEDGMSVEPSWYMPIIPMVLVNGCEGIDPGSKNYIPSYNPRDVIANLKRLLNGETVIPMDPWYKGFKGSVKNARSKAAGVTYTITGVIKEVDNTKLKITELPVRYWTVDYKNFLESVCPPNEKEKGNEKNKGKGMVKVLEPPFVEEYRSRCDHANVEFEVILSEQNMNVAKKKGLEKKFRLTATIKTTNVNLFDSDGKIRTYGTPEDILKEFFQLRHKFYARRKAIMLQNIGNEILKLKNKVRFILAVISEDIIVNNRKTAELFLELKQKGYEPLAENVPVGGTEVDEENEESPVEAAAGVSASDYEYLLAVAICTLNEEKAQELIARMNKLEAEAEILGRATSETLWLGELDALEKELDVLDGKSGHLEEGTTRWRGKTRKARRLIILTWSPEHSGNPAAEKPKTTIRKRAPARSKDVFKPTGDSNSNVPSPKKKVRKMRAPPFNKKSGSVRLRITSASTGTDDAGAPLSGSLAQPVAPRRTAREMKAKAIYIDWGSDDNV